MDNLEDQQWPNLHRRVVEGDTLSVTEQAVYEAMLQQLDAEEHLDGDLERIRALRHEIIAAENSQIHLRQREAELEARIAALESCLDTRTRALIGIGN
jgi:hypothetical protein